MPHLPKKATQQSAIIRKVLPQHLPLVIRQHHLRLGPYLQIQPIEQLIIIPIEQQPVPSLIFCRYLLQMRECLFEIFVVLDLSVDGLLPVVDGGFGGAAGGGAGAELDEFLFRDFRVLCAGEGGDDLVLDPRQAEVCKRDELLQKLQLIIANPHLTKPHHPPQHPNHKLIIPHTNLLPKQPILMHSHIPNRQLRLVQHIVNSRP